MYHMWILKSKVVILKSRKTELITNELNELKEMIEKYVLIESLRVKTMNKE